MFNLQVTPGHKAAQRGVVGAVRVACRSLCPRSGLRRSLEDQVCQRWHAMHWDSPVNDNQAGQNQVRLSGMQQRWVCILGLYITSSWSALPVAATWVCKPLCKQLLIV